MVDNLFKKRVKFKRKISFAGLPTFDNYTKRQTSYKQNYGEIIIKQEQIYSQIKLVL